ncbi:SIMPL domain-containing protein [Tepidiforma bonchosmolovskayae]|uniref:SIMPL domain-containing protein n=1 Tax=Tepidiforma bonchosmolovskayae TaxID=2601677 RepID=UPI00178877E2|nr:SIMPL domain-containing protein [Tepidiforma bonchosmolovskayae]
MTRSRRSAALIAVAALVLFAAACSGDTTILSGESPTDLGITVTGTGEAAAPPDMATLDLGIEVAASSVADARERAAQAAARLIASVKANGVADRDIQTRAIAVQPQYDYSRPGAPVITGYAVQNVLTVRVRDLDRLGRVIDDALAAAGDAARLNSLQLGFSKQDDLLETARKNAVTDARRRAETFAAAAGVRVGDVLAITETAAGGPVPLGLPAGRSAADTATPVEVGESTVTVTVSVRFAIEQ